MIHGHLILEAAGIECAPRGRIPSELERVEDMCRRYGISRRSLNRARVLLRHGRPETIERVRRGEWSVTRGWKEVRGLE